MFKSFYVFIPIPCNKCWKKDSNFNFLLLLLLFIFYLPLDETVLGTPTVMLFIYHMMKYLCLFAFLKFS